MSWDDGSEGTDDGEGEWIAHKAILNSRIFTILSENVNKHAQWHSLGGERWVGEVQLQPQPAR
jgi:hypothetical protein